MPANGLGVKFIVTALVYKERSGGNRVKILYIIAPVNNGLPNGKGSNDLLRFPPSTSSRRFLARGLVSTGILTRTLAVSMTSLGFSGFPFACRSLRQAGFGQNMYRFESLDDLTTQQAFGQAFYIR